MTKIISLLIIVLLFTYFFSFANDFTIEKINTFAFAQNFNTSEESIIIEYPYLYALTSHGLEIYEIMNNAHLQQLAVLSIRSPDRFVKKDNFIYITNLRNDIYDLFPICLYQVDITDKENPYIYNEIEFDETIRYFILQIYNNYLYLLNGYIPDRIYTIPDLEFFTSIPASIDIEKINDSIGINMPYANLLDIYDVSDFTNIQQIGTIDMTPIHGNCGTRYFEMLNDTILIAGGQSAVSFWNISDSANWEYISHYELDEYMIFGKNFTIIDTFLALTRFDGLELLDISDIYNPQSVDFIEYLIYGLASASYNDDLYLATWVDGIRRYKVENNEINFIENIFEYPYFHSGYIYSNYLFVQTFHYGFYLFDISNPDAPVEIATSLSNPNYKDLKGYENLIVTKDWTDYNYKIFDISDPLNPVLINTIPVGDYYQVSWSYLSFDDTELNTVYFFTVYPNTIIRKYDISEPGNTILLFEYTDLDGDSFFVKNGYGYLLNDINNYQNLYILNGLYENTPYLANTIDHFSEYIYTPLIRPYNNYLGLFYKSEYDETKFFNLNDPLIPTFAFELSVPSNYACPGIYDDILFTSTWTSSYIYDISGNPSGILETIDSINGFTYIRSIDFYNSGDNNYLFTIEESDIGVFEFSYSHSVGDEILNQDNIILNNYPNPFSNSTTISFSGTLNSHELSQIRIYNVKGQLVKNFELRTPNSEFMKVVWDGKDEDGKSLSDGIYFYKLISKNQSLTRKMLLLR
ncbi:MAG: T9SS type A sorting domain-containing protein [Candidatus Cloacimonadota bacterium]|nr:T9SS type A sorting domain-containing protein [Candidatus Cloacimonadota bacterium]